MENEAIILKIFAGPQAGGEALLSDGEYNLGRDASSDIVIDDVLVAAIHCRLTIAEAGARLEPIDGVVYVEGQRFPGGDIPLFDYVTIGGTCFALGTSKSQWPVRPIPEIRREPAPEPDVSQPAEPPEADPSKFPVQTAGNRWRGVSLYLGFLTVGALFLILSVAAAAGSMGSKSTATAEKAEIPMEEQLWTIVRQLGTDSDIQVEKTKSGWTVSGYLSQKGQRTQLLEELRGLLPASAIKLWDSESLAESAQAVLSGLHVPRAAKAGKPGEVVVSGAVTEPDKWQKARQRIVRDIVAIRTLTDQVEVASNKIRPKSIEITRPVAVERASARPEAKIDQAATASNSSTPTGAAPEAVPATIVRNVFLLPDEAEAPPRPNPSIQSVNVGVYRSLVTNEGTRIMQGGRLDGWMVMEIAEDKVVLERGKYRHIVDLLSP